MDPVATACYTLRAAVAGAFQRQLGLVSRSWNLRFTRPCPVSFRGDLDPGPVRRYVCKPQRRLGIVRALAAARSRPRPAVAVSAPLTTERCWDGGGPTLRKAVWYLGLQGQARHRSLARTALHRILQRFDPPRTSPSFVQHGSPLRSCRRARGCSPSASELHIQQTGRRNTVR